MKLVVHTDGGSRGNPGPAAIGVVIEDGTTEISGYGKVIGETTNNVAEYTAVVDALKTVQQRWPTVEEVHFFLDSLLVVNQLNGIYKVKDATLRGFLLEIRGLEQGIGCPISYTAVRREYNVRADFFVNKALDEHLLM